MRTPTYLHVANSSVTALFQLQSLSTEKLAGDKPK